MGPPGVFGGLGCSLACPRFLHYYLSSPALSLEYLNSVFDMQELLPLHYVLSRTASLRPCLCLPWRLMWPLPLEALPLPPLESVWPLMASVYSGLSLTGYRTLAPSPVPWVSILPCTSCW